MSTGNGNVLLNDFARLWADIGPDVLAATSAVGESGWYVLGREVSEFEREFAAYSHVDHVVGCASGLDAIELGLRSLGLQPGDKVLTTPMSAFATTLAIVRAGGVPVFCDTDQNGLLDLDRAEQAFERDAQLRHCVPVHLYGHVLDLDRLEALQRRYQLRIVEDMAQAVGGHWRSRSVGSVGQVSATSFYPTKNLGALGDGGAVLTSDAGVDAACRRLRDYGQSAKYIHDVIGLNSRLDELQAALLRRALLPRLPKFTQRRREIAQAYLQGITNAKVRPLAPPAESASVWHLFPVLVDASQRTAFCDHLRARGVGSGLHYPVLIPDQKALLNTSFEVIGELDNARVLAAGQVSLPIHPYLDAAEVARVLAAVNDWS